MGHVCWTSAQVSERLHMNETVPSDSAQLAQAVPLMHDTLSMLPEILDNYTYFSTSNLDLGNDLGPCPLETMPDPSSSELSQPISLCNSSATIPTPLDFSSAYPSTFASFMSNPLTEGFPSSFSAQLFAFPEEPSVVDQPCTSNANRLGLSSLDNNCHDVDLNLLIQQTGACAAQDSTQEAGMADPRYAVQIPLSLSAPVIHARTNPYVDLGAHLRLYGMEAEAQEFTLSQTTCDFVLTAFLTMYAAPGTTSLAEVSNAGEILMLQMEQVVSAHDLEIQVQLASMASQRNAKNNRVPIPSELRVSWRYSLNQPTNSTSVPPFPSHFLAVCKRSCMPVEDEVRTVEGPCFIVPIHWIVYVLQCAHLPMPHNATDGIPVMECAVPFPQHWSLIHRWLYTRDPGKLLAALLPSGTLRALRASEKESLAQAAVSALTALSLDTLLSTLLKIRATYHNGCSVGLYAESFWATLNRAWNMTVCALVIRRGRANHAAYNTHPTT
ncbi:hypothetical protein MYAM1_003383 [Malassezia yamatoensis]|uniref:Uncharacterized protein n=1 Tax=Malassezia yamatoensis TaxID=253288 RepID=A0AAJ6CKD4_9BASI|nr:hypothetical protein MYAM1_003383 [Malassezia yamatoensis]